MWRLSSLLFGENFPVSFHGNFGSRMSDFCSGGGSKMCLKSTIAMIFPVNRELSGNFRWRAVRHGLRRAPFLLVSVSAGRSGHRFPLALSPIPACEPGEQGGAFNEFSRLVSGKLIPKNQTEQRTPEIPFSPFFEKKIYRLRLSYFSVAKHEVACYCGCMAKTQKPLVVGIIAVKSLLTAAMQVKISAV